VIGGSVFRCVFSFSLCVRFSLVEHICIVQHSTQCNPKFQFSKLGHRKKFENTSMYLYTLYLKNIHTCRAIVTSSIPRDRQRPISGCGGAWPPPFALLCLLACASACAVPFGPLGPSGALLGPSSAARAPKCVSGLIL